MRMLAVKNSQKRSAAFGSGRNSAGGLALTAAHGAHIFPCRLAGAKCLKSPRLNV